MKSFAIHAILTVAAMLPLNGRALEVPPVVGYSFTPSNPTAGDFIRFRMDVDGCFHHPFGASFVSDEAAIEVRIFGLDYTCDPSDPENVATPRFSDVGQLPAGVYATRVLFCVPVPPPEEYACNMLQEGALVVSGTPSLPSIVPTTSSSALAMLVLLALVGGLIAFRRG